MRANAEIMGYVRRSGYTLAQLTHRLWSLLHQPAGETANSLELIEKFPPKVLGVLEDALEPVSQDQPSEIREEVSAELEENSKEDSHMVTPSVPEMYSIVLEDFRTDFEYLNNADERDTRAEVRACIAQRFEALRQLLNSPTEDALALDVMVRTGKDVGLDLRAMTRLVRHECPLHFASSSEWQSFSSELAKYVFGALPAEVRSYMRGVTVGINGSGCTLFRKILSISITLSMHVAVSYTHLTLPTKRIV